MGYDIADYEDIDPAYGTLADVDNLIKELKKRDMRLVMDLVVNHTSNEVSLEILMARFTFHGMRALLRSFSFERRCNSVC